MTITQSNLSASGYDLVVGTTQDAINHAFCAYLKSAVEGQTFRAYYKFDDVSQSIVPAHPGMIQGEIETALWAIPNGATQNDVYVRRLDEMDFVFAIGARAGPGRMDTIVLDQGETQVTYHPDFEWFSIQILEEHGRTLRWTNLTQTPAAPWAFKFNVKLDMRAADQTAFAALPADVQARVKNLDPGTAFGVQQLFLDLNTPGLQTAPNIDGLDPSSRTYLELTRVFFNLYWDRLKASGTPLLGYAVTPAVPALRSSSLVPTDLTIVVSPHRAADGHPSGKYGLYTLNYLAMSEGRAMPAPAPFAWNWVEEGEAAIYQGAVTVRRDAFAGFLARLIPPFTRLAVVPSVSMTHSGEDLSWTYAFSWSPAAPAFKVDPQPTGGDGFTTLLTLAWGQSSHDDSKTSLHDSSVEGDFNYSLTGDVSVNADTIRMRLRAVSYFNWREKVLTGSWANITGNVVDYEAIESYHIAVDSTGRMSATPLAPTFTDRSDDMDITTWDHMVGQGAINTMNDMRNALGFLRGALQGYEDALARLLNSSHAWVFPGGRSLAFRDVAFSEHQDLIAHAAYADSI